MTTHMKLYLMPVVLIRRRGYSQMPAQAELPCFPHPTFKMQSSLIMKGLKD